MQRLAPLLMPRGIGGRHRQRHARHRRAALHRFGEGDPLGVHHEIENVAVLAGGEIVIKSLLVVDGEGRRLFLLKGRQPLPLPPCPLQLDALAHDFRHRKPGAQVVKELGREAHGVILSRHVSRGERVYRYSSGGGKYDETAASPGYSQPCPTRHSGARRSREPGMTTEVTATAGTISPKTCPTRSASASPPASCKDTSRPRSPSRRGA